MLERLPHFRSLLAGWDADYKANKGLVFLHPTYADRLASTLPIKAILLPAVTHQAHAAFQRVAPTEVFRQLGPSTVIWLPGAEADNYRFTAELVRRLPCYRLELAADPQRNVDAICTLIEMCIRDSSCTSSMASAPRTKSPRSSSSTRPTSVR